ncbi:MAG: hydrogenase [Desulfitobacterium hafniense]|nr:hydrogenase [Desulfitobacterium hafniense]
MSINTMDSLQQLLIFALAASGLGIVSSSKIRKALNWWTIHAVFLSALILIEALHSKEWETFLVVIVSLGIKAIFIPWLLGNVIKNSHTQWVGELFLTRVSSLVAAGVLTLLAYLITQPLMSLIEPTMRNGLAIAFSLLFYGLLLMIIRKVALVQVLGILLIDNGIFLAGFLLTQGMPILIELGIFFDVLIAALILGVLAKRMIRDYDSLNVDHMNSLKG